MMYVIKNLMAKLSEKQSRATKIHIKGVDERGNKVTEPMLTTLAASIDEDIASVHAEAKKCRPFVA